MQFSFATALSRIFTFWIGVGLKKGSDFGFDYILYPFVIVQFGYVAGGIIMTFASIGLNLFGIRFYDFCKSDVFFIETLKDSKNTKSYPSLFRRLSKLGRPAIFLALCCIEDPFVVTLYFRQGSGHYNGMARRDWKNFAFSTIVSNLLWSSGLGLTIELLFSFYQFYS